MALTVIVTLVAAGGMAVALLDGLASRVPTASPSHGFVPSPTRDEGTATTASPTFTSLPTSTSSPSFPGTVAERRLWEQLPAAFRTRCGQSADPLPGSTAAIACPLALGDDADEVLYDRFSARTQMNLAINRLTSRLALGENGCLATSPPGYDDWELGALWSGRRVCFEADGAAWVWWSYEEELILARVVRRDASWEPLIDWWDQYSILLRPSP